MSYFKQWYPAYKDLSSCFVTLPRQRERPGLIITGSTFPGWRAALDGSADPDAGCGKESEDGGRVKHIGPDRTEADHAPVLCNLAQLAIVKQPDQEPPFGDSYRHKSEEIRPGNVGPAHSDVSGVDEAPHSEIGGACYHADQRSNRAGLPRGHVAVILHRQETGSRAVTCELDRTERRVANAGMADTARHTSPQMLLEELRRPAPGQLGAGAVVHGGALLVHEGMLGIVAEYLQ